MLCKKKSTNSTVGKTAVKYGKIYGVPGIEKQYCKDVNLPRGPN